MKKMFLLGAIVVVVAISGQPTRVPVSTPRTDHRQPTTAKRLEVHVTPEMIRHSRIDEALYFTGTVYSIAILLLILATGWSARMRDFAQRWVRWPFVAAMLYFILLSLVTAALTFPLDFYGGFVVPHQFDLTDQSFAGWLGDVGKGLGVNVVIFTPLAAIALVIIRRIRRWWFVLWIGTIPLIILGVLATPLVIDPLFNDFGPLRDASLRQALLDEASRAGIEQSRVLQVAKPKQTTEMNA